MKKNTTRIVTLSALAINLLLLGINGWNMYRIGEIKKLPSIIASNFEEWPDWLVSSNGEKVRDIKKENDKTEADDKRAKVLDLKHLSPGDIIALAGGYNVTVDQTEPYGGGSGGFYIGNVTAKQIAADDEYRRKHPVGVTITMLFNGTKFSNDYQWNGNIFDGPDQMNIEKVYRKSDPCVQDDTLLPGQSCSLNIQFTTDPEHRVQP